MGKWWEIDEEELWYLNRRKTRCGRNNTGFLLEFFTWWLSGRHAGDGTAADDRLLQAPTPAARQGPEGEESQQGVGAQTSGPPEQYGGAGAPAGHRCPGPEGRGRSGLLMSSNKVYTIIYFISSRNPMHLSVFWRRLINTLFIRPWCKTRPLDTLFIQEAVVPFLRTEGFEFLWLTGIFNHSMCELSQPCLSPIRTLREQLSSSNHRG